MKRIFDSVAQTVEQKNHDYDHAFDKSCDIFGNMYAASKIYEKTVRIITLTNEPAQVDGEGLIDALKDCMGYCALYINRLQQQ